MTYPSRTFLLLVFAVAVCALRAEQAPPLQIDGGHAWAPVGAELARPPQVPAEQAPPLQSLVESERAFAKMSVDKGRKEAFLAYFADDAIFLAPGPVKARPAIEAWPAGGVRLDWEPRFGDIAASGDLGYTTGPFERTSASGHQTGWFFTIWKKQPDGRWKVAIDAGITSPADGGLRSLPFVAASAGAVTEAGSAAPSLASADRTLCESIASAGVLDAFLGVSTDLTRIYRDTHQPIVGHAAIRSFFGTPAGRMSCEPVKDESARSGDLGYAYGKYVLERTPRESGSYLRVWTRRSGQWKLAFDLLVPGA